MNTPRDSLPVNGFDFARTIIEEKDDEAIETLLQCANDAETDWLEKKASVYPSEVADSDYQKLLGKLQNAPEETCRKEVAYYENKLLKEVACAIVALHNSRGGVVLIGVDDNNVPVPLGKGLPGAEAAMTGTEVERFIREDILGRLCPTDGLFDCKGETWTIPVQETGVYPKVCRFHGSQVVALLVPSLKPEGVPLVSTITRNNHPEDRVLMRKSGDIGQTLKGRDENRWVGTEAQKVDFIRNRCDGILSENSLSGKLRKLGLVVSHLPVIQFAEAPAGPIFSSVKPPLVAAENFFGRDKELEKLNSLLLDGKIPVVTGPGGTGKTELVLQYAERHKADYPGGLFQIDMETVRSWDDAFRSMLDRTGVQQALGILESRCEEKKQDFNGESTCTAGMREEADGEIAASPSGALEEDSVRKTESGMDILFDRARREGKVLLVLDNVDPPTCKSLFKEPVLSRLSTPPEVRIVATARASDLTFPANGRCYEFLLSDLPPKEAVKLLLSDHPAALEADHEAAEHIARILGFRILYLKTIPSLLEDDDSIFAGSYRILEKELRRDLAGVIAAGMEGDEKRTPPALWQITKRTFCANAENGKRWILLAWIASLFSPNLGVRKEVLSALWKRIAAPNYDPEIAFSQATKKLLKHGVLEERDGGFGMHRLTCMAVRRSARKSNPRLEDEIGRTLSEYDGMSPNDWLSLSASLPALGHVPRKIRNAAFHVDVLLRNKAYASMCPWDEIDGRAWAKLLCWRPEYADRCKWDKLDGRAWARLLCWRPRFADRYNWWAKLDGRDWTLLLRKQPHFANKCPRKKLDGFAWSGLLSAQPQFADKCPPWEKLSGAAWAGLLRAQPKFADKCPWKRLAGSDWVWLLTKQPRFADKCQWDMLNDNDWADLFKAQPQFDERLDGNTWARLLERLPQFADKCPWKKLGKGVWGRLLSKQPQFADKCPWDSLDGDAWAVLLGAQPQFADKCQWEKLDGGNWAVLLGAQPQFADKCQWEKLDGGNWAMLLGKQPVFADMCQWEKLDGDAWAVLLGAQPQFADKCQWEKLDGGDWARLLMEQPQLADKYQCPWWKLDGGKEYWLHNTSNEQRPGNQLNGILWARLLGRQPQFADKCLWDSLDGGAWAVLLGAQPQFADKCQWNKMDGDAWVWLLKRQPQFIDTYRWDTLLAHYNWADLLGVRPEFADKCQWNNLDGKDWAILLEQQPQFADKCPWGKLEGSDWAWLLRVLPLFADKCLWRKLDGGKDYWLRHTSAEKRLGNQLNGILWAWLLEKQPQFANKCPWEKLEGGAWAWLLGTQPQFADKRPWEKLDGAAWAWLLSNQPQFADHCTWAKLNDEDWGRLLESQPQFAGHCPPAILRRIQENKNGDSPG